MIASGREASCADVPSCWEWARWFSFAAPQGEHLWEACRTGLRELGYVEGRNIVLEPRFAGGRHERLPALVAELVKLKVDVLVSAATPASLVRGKRTVALLDAAAASKLRRK